MITRKSMLHAVRQVADANPEFRKALASELRKTGALDAADFNRHVTAHLLNDKAFVKRTKEWVKAWLKTNKVTEISDQDLDLATKQMLFGAEPKTESIQRVMSQVLKHHKDG